MTVPALPADVSSGGAASSAHMNSVLDLLEFLRDARPVYKGRLQTPTTSDGSGGFEVANATTVDFGRSPSGNPVPDINIGGFDYVSSGDPREVTVPEAGVYRVTAWARFEGNTSGRRQMLIQHEGSTIDGSLMRAAASPSSTTSLVSTCLIDCNADDELLVRVYQDSGSALDVEVWLSAEWLVSS